MSSSDDYFITIKSGEDTLTVSKDGKTFGNIKTKEVLPI